jgi:hypothetical protein
LALAFEQNLAGARLHEHSEAAFHLDQVLVDKVLIGFEHGEGIDPELGRDIADGGKGIAFLENAVEDHMDPAIAQLAVNRLTIVPFTVHSWKAGRVFPSGAVSCDIRTGLLI